MQIFTLHYNNINYMWSHIIMFATYLWKHCENTNNTIYLLAWLTQHTLWVVWRYKFTCKIVMSFFLCCCCISVFTLTWVSITHIPILYIHQTSELQSIYKHATDVVSYSLLNIINIHTCKRVNLGSVLRGLYQHNFFALCISTSDKVDTFMYDTKRPNV